MIKLKEHKHSTENKPIQAALLPKAVYIPLSQHLGKICSPEVKTGDTVLRGQKIASAQANVYAPIHASLSGKISAIREWPHPLLGRSTAIVIESDGLDRSLKSGVRSVQEVEKLTPEQIRNIVFEAGIVGMGGAAFPTHIKLNPPAPVDSLIINGAECEPYLTADNRLMIERTREIIAGIGLIAKCIGAKNVYIAIEDNKPEAIKAFESGVRGTGYAVRVLKSEYPQGGEKQLIKAVLKREVPAGKLPFDAGVVVQNVATVFAIYEAVYLGKPLYERVVTVTGDCLENPANLLARVGTPIKDLISQCGPLNKEPQKIVFGGPMMGIAQYTADVPVIKNTNGIILLSENRIKEAEEGFCIRCSRCVEACPLGLMPCLISQACAKERWDLAKAYGCMECMECGLCNYACPRSRNIVQHIKYAKARIKK